MKTNCSDQLKILIKNAVGKNIFKKIKSNYSYLNHDSKLYVQEQSDKRNRLGKRNLLHFRPA